MPRLHCPKCHEINIIEEGAPKACDFCGFGHPGGVVPEPVDPDAPPVNPNEGKMPWDDDYDHEYERMMQVQAFAEPAYEEPIYEAPVAPPPVAPIPAVPVAPPPPAQVPPATPATGLDVPHGGISLLSDRIDVRAKAGVGSVPIRALDGIALRRVPRPIMIGLGLALVATGLVSAAGLLLANYVLVYGRRVLAPSALLILLGVVLVATGSSRALVVHAGEAKLALPVPRDANVDGFIHTAMAARHAATETKFAPDIKVDVPEPKRRPRPKPVDESAARVNGATAQAPPKAETNPATPEPNTESVPEPADESVPTQPESAPRDGEPWAIDETAKAKSRADEVLDAVLPKD